ncbi:MAG: hypothetical protein Q8W48_08880 [Candidatus Palauibacterales bacterium]|nr:hypothetical protein [Candidatus Palauibacterales bacterium]
MNREKTHIPCGMVVGLLVVGLAGCGGSDIEPVPPDLSGSWELNVAKSDLPAEEIEDAMVGGSASGSQPPAGGGGRGGGASGGRGGGRGGRMGGMNPEQMRERMREIMEAARAFTITQTDSTVTLNARSGPTRVFYTDGRKVQRMTRGLGEVEVKARWKDGKLQVEQKMESGLKITETYERSEDGERLQVNVKLSGGRLPRDFESRRVYDDASEGEKNVGEDAGQQ